MSWHITERFRHKFDFNNWIMVWCIDYLILIRERKFNTRKISEHLLRKNRMRQTQIEYILDNRKVKLDIQREKKECIRTMENMNHLKRRSG